MFGCNEQHRGDFLQFDDHIVGVSAVNIGKRVVARRPALAVGRIEQENLLPVMRAESRARVIILALHIEDDDRALPRQQVRNDDAGAFTRSRGGFDNNMLATAEGQEPPALAAKDDSDGGAKAVALDLALVGKAGGPVERRTARPQQIDKSGKQRDAAGQSARHCADHLGIAAIIPNERWHLDRVVGGNRQTKDQPSDHACDGKSKQCPERDTDQQLRRATVRRRACPLGHSRSPSPEIRRPLFWFAPRHRPAF